MDIFDSQASLLHTGTGFGCVHPSDPNFELQLGRIHGIIGQDKILAQKLGFNTKVTPIKDFSNLEQGKLETFYRTPEASDGVVVSITGDTLLKVAVMIMNADCGTIEILAPNGEMAVLHGGFDNIDNKDGSSIVNSAINYFVNNGINPRQLKFRMGEAAQTCCYGLNSPVAKPQTLARADRLAQKYGIDVIKPVINPPRSENDGIGFDVPLMAARQADLAGIKDIEVERLCTSCHGLIKESMEQPDTFGTWYSNLRESPKTVKEKGYGARNAVVVY